MLAFRLTGLPDSRLPLYLYCVGTKEEKVQFRPDWISGISAFFVAQRIIYMKYDKAIPFEAGAVSKRATGVL